MIDDKARRALRKPVIVGQDFDQMEARIIDLVSRDERELAQVKIFAEIAVRDAIKQVTDARQMAIQQLPRKQRSHDGDKA